MATTSRTVSKTAVTQSTPEMGVPKPGILSHISIADPDEFLDSTQWRAELIGQSAVPLGGGFCGDNRVGSISLNIPVYAGDVIRFIVIGNTSTTYQIAATVI